MEANKTELLLAWMTLVKLRDSNVLDAGDDQIVLSTLQILDKEQSQMEDYSSSVIGVLSSRCCCKAGRNIGLIAIPLCMVADVFMCDRIERRMESIVIVALGNFAPTRWLNFMISC